MIISAMDKCDNQPNRALHYLQNKPGFPTLFHKLSITSICNWYALDSKGRRYLKDSVKSRWLIGKNPRGDNCRPYFLSNHMDIHEEIIRLLQNLRKASACVNSVVILPLFRAILKKRLPQLNVRPTRPYIRYWIGKYMNFSYKKATTNQRKIPANCEFLQQCFVNRIIATAAKRNIKHASFIINWDQTAVMLMGNSQYTYHSKQEKDVSIIGFDDKRQITAVVGTNWLGEMIPIQLVFGGQESKPHQKKAVPSPPNDEIKRGIKSWHLTQSPSHWSTFNSMKEYVDNVIHPYIQKKGEENKIEEKPFRAILIMDCWKVHKGKEFLSWISEKYPQYSIVFVPASCTAVMQPCDLFVQRPFKHSIKSYFDHWISGLVTKELDDGISIENLNLNFGLPQIKQKTLEFCLNSYEEMGNERIIKMMKEGIDELGFSNMWDIEKQLESIQFCEDNHIDLGQSQEVLMGGEVEDEIIPISSSLQEEYQEDEEEDESNSEEYNERSTFQVVNEVVNRVRTRSHRRDANRSRAEEDGRIARRYQDEEFEEMDE